MGDGADGAEMTDMWNGGRAIGICPKSVVDSGNT